MWLHLAAHVLRQCVAATMLLLLLFFADADAAYCWSSLSDPCAHLSSAPACCGAWELEACCGCTSHAQVPFAAMHDHLNESSIWPAQHKGAWTGSHEPAARSSRVD